MSWGVIAPPQSCSAISTNPRIPPVIRQRCCSVIPPDKSSFSPNLKPIISCGLLKLPAIDFRCNSTAGDSGIRDNESKTVLDAFFLGKALGEALNERIESSVGEFLSIIGRLQAEQQKQVQEFQEEVLEKARRAKEQASREAMEARGLVSKSTSSGASTVDSISKTTSSFSEPTDEDPLMGLLKD